MTILSLAEVLDANLLSAVFQPIVSTSSMEVVGYEGLIRGPSATALASPTALFSAAQASDRRLELEMRCLRTVWMTFDKLELPGKLFLNVSAAALLAQPGRQRDMLQMLADIGIDGDRVVLEITEEQGVSDFRRLRRIGQLLRRHGFSLAIDDLGAGYASLRMWLELRPAWVKIDIMFVHGVQRDPIKQAFMRSIRDIARVCCTRVIAEGIETEEELAFVRDLGIDYGQGYYIAHPKAMPSALRPYTSCVIASSQIG